MLKSLKKLDISHCLKFDALYEEDMCKLTQLTHLEMERCPFMTNIAVVDSLMYFSHLKVLNLSGSILFTGFLLPVISRVCKSLEVLDISYCPAMSTPPESYESLRSLSSLRCLDVGGCSDDRGVVARRLLPHIRVFV
jgi:Leucine-rich repeat (LRR) protein